MSSQEVCLGLAVLDLWRIAKERRQSVKDLCKTFRYLHLKKTLSNNIFFSTNIPLICFQIDCCIWCSLHPLEQSQCSSFFSYKSCLPKSHRLDIQKRNRLDRYRIRNTLKHFLKKCGISSVDECSLKLKYLIVLTCIEPSLGSETFQVNPSSSSSNSAFALVRVIGETGIQTSGSCDPDGALVRTCYTEW